MASTNKTTNYDLSQFIGSDKPTFLGDYNSDMLKIDAQMKTNADNVATAISGINTATVTANSANQTAQTANTTANSASTTASEASTTATNAQSTANSALATATTAQSTANTANTTANTANSKADSIASKLNLSNVTEFNYNQITIDSGSLSEGKITVAINSDGSLFKFYGVIKGSNVQVCKIQTDLRPTSNYTITPAGHDSNGFARSITVKTTGEIEFNLGWASNTTTAIYYPCLYWNSDFSDDPAPTV